MCRRFTFRVGVISPSSWLRSRGMIANFFTVSARLEGARQVGVREAVTLMAQGRLDIAPLITHRFTLDEIQKAYDVVADRSDGVLKAIITL